MRQRKVLSKTDEGRLLSREEDYVPSGGRSRGKQAPIKKHAQPLVPVLPMESLAPGGAAESPLDEDGE